MPPLSTPSVSSWALLLTDMVDSTGLNACLGDVAMAEVWQTHDRLARDLQRAWNGREIDKSDGMLALFASADDAAACVLKLHEQIAARKLPFAVRAAVHVGPLSLHANAPADVTLGAKPIEVTGLAVSVTARMMGLARGGQTLCSSDARAALEAKPAAERSIGFWRLQGLSEPMEVFEIAARADALLGAPDDRPKAYRVTRRGEHWEPTRDLPHSLPAERDSFVGRQAALATLKNAFDSGARLVSVHGLGGVGKTRLAIRFGWALRGDHAGGSWFCDLSQARSLDGLVFAVAQGLGIPLSTEDPMMQIGRALAGRGDCLVVLDNFEQVIGHSEQSVGRWLMAAPQARFLVTTREVMGIPGEHVLSLDPLPGPDGEALFMLRAAAARVGFKADDADKSAIEHLVRLIDGLPLAIELVAARVRVMPPRLLAARMQDRFTLASARTGRLDRQLTLRTALDWSWDMLADTERATLARLSVFEGGFTADAAAAVLGSEGADADAWVDALQALIDKSLLRAVGNERYAQLETVREYAGLQLRREGSFTGSGKSCTTDALRAHWRYFASLDERLATAQRGIETNNLVIACRSAAEAGDAESAAACAAAAWSALRRSGPYRTAVELARFVLAMPGLDDTSRALVHGVIGDALESQGNAEAAREELRRGLEAAARGVVPEVRGRLLVTLGNRESVDGHFAEARAHLDDAMALAKVSHSETLRMHALNALGAHHDLQAQWTQAQRCYEQALVVAQALSDQHMQAGLLGNLGGVHRDQGRPSEAAWHYEASLTLACELGDRRWEGNARCNMGLLLQEQGKHDPARQQFEQALSLAREIGHVRLAYTVLCNLGILLADEGRLDNAGEHFERAVLTARDSADRRAEGQFSGYLAVNQAQRGLIDAARATIASARHLLHDARGDSYSHALLWCDHAEVEWLGGHRVPAAQALGQAREIAQALGCAADSELGRRVVALEASLAGATPESATP
jgi:predicted ATPase/class 3 adenylate cyclase